MRDAKVLSMSVLHGLRGLSVGDSQYSNKLKKKIEENFLTQTWFVSERVYISEVVISNKVFKNIIIILSIETPP